MSIEEEFESLYEDAYISACELDSPNSIGFDALCEAIYERMCNQLGVSA